MTLSVHSASFSCGSCQSLGTMSLCTCCQHVRPAFMYNAVASVPPPCSWSSRPQRRLPSCLPCLAHVHDAHPCGKKQLLSVRTALVTCTARVPASITAAGLGTTRLLSAAHDCIQALSRQQSRAVEAVVHGADAMQSL